MVAILAGSSHTIGAGDENGFAPHKYQTNLTLNALMNDASMNGLVLIDKPPGWTSHDVVNRWRRLAGSSRAGHLGTLDPMATGLLAVMTGTATRLAPFLADNDKTYVAEITFGLISDTYDVLGQVRKTGCNTRPDLDAIHSVLDSFRGKTFQAPPPFSAKKIQGVPAYKLARKQVQIELKPVEIEITRLEITSASENAIELLIVCSAGTYIRSLAHDLGQGLACGGVLSRLRRTRAGAFDVQQASTLEHLAALAESKRLYEAVIPAAQLLPHIPGEHFNFETVAHIRQGRDFRTSPFVVPSRSPLVKALSETGELVAIGELIFPNLYHPRTVF